MTTDPHHIWTDDRAPAREASTDEKAEAQRIAANLKAKADQLAAAYSRPSARSGGPTHVPKAPKIRG